MTDERNYVTLTDDDFQQQVIESNQPVLVDFWAPWCPPCRVLGPVVEALADEFKGQVKVGKLNVDENPRVAQRYGIRSIPTLLFFERGEVVDQVVGVVPKALLEGKLTSLAQAA